MTMQVSTHLAVGMTAPLFSAGDIFGSPIELQSYQGRSVLLSFYRNAACALCNLQVHQLIEKHADYQRRGLDILAVFESPRENLRQYVGKQDAPFPIIADPQAKLYTLYGVEVSEDRVMASMEMAVTQQRVQEAVAHGFELTREEGSNFFRLPADFLIGTDQVIREVYYAQVVGQHMAFERIEAFL